MTFLLEVFVLYGSKISSLILSSIVSCRTSIILESSSELMSFRSGTLSVLPFPRCGTADAAAVPFSVFLMFTTLSSAISLPGLSVSFLCLLSAASFSGLSDSFIWFALELIF